MAADSLEAEGTGYSGVGVLDGVWGEREDSWNW
jgi:hypothetical protein